MEIRFSEKALKIYQKKCNEGKYYAIDLVKCGCCGYAFNLIETRPKSDYILVAIEGTSINLPVSKEAKTFLRRAKVEYNDKSFFNKGFKIFPNQF